MIIGHEPDLCIFVAMSTLKNEKKWGRMAVCERKVLLLCFEKK